MRVNRKIEIVRLVAIDSNSKRVQRSAQIMVFMCFDVTRLLVIIAINLAVCRFLQIKAQLRFLSISIRCLSVYF